MACLTPTAPASSNVVSTIYGVPRGTAGRGGRPIQGIVIHCLQESIDKYNAKICAGGIYRRDNRHSSVHFSVAPTGDVYQYVDEGDVAWGMQAYPSSFPDITPDQAPVGWTVLPALYPNVSLDLYTLQIGVAVPRQNGYLNQPGCQGCGCGDGACGGYGLSDAAYKNLVRLVAYLAKKYSIPIDTQHIWTHDRVVDTPETELECLCLPDCFTCDVSNYCEECSNPSDSSYKLAPGVVYFYGEDANGCKVKSNVAITVAETPNTIIQTDTVAGSTSGTNGRNLTFNVRVAPAQANIANQLVSVAGAGLYVPVGAGVNALDTPTVDMNFNGATGSISANTKISAAAGNILQANVDGLYVATQNFDLCAAISSLQSGGVAVAGSTRFVGPDCKVYTLPSTNVVQTPITTQNSTTLTLAASGTDSHTLVGSVIISGAAGNMLQVQAGGLYVAPSAAIDTCTAIANFAQAGPITPGTTLLVGADCKLYTVPANPGQTPITANDSSTIDFTVSGSNSHTLDASVKVSATAGNQIVANADGLFVAAPTPFDLCTSLSALTSGGSGVAGTTQFVGPDCKIYTLPPAFSETTITANDTSTVDLSSSGTSGHVLQAAVKVSATAGNQIAVNADGLFVPAPASVSETPITTTNSSTATITASGVSNHSLLVNVRVSSSAGNLVAVNADGLYVGTPVQTPLTVNDSSTIDFTANGTDAHTLTGSVKVSATAGNQITVNADGIYAAALAPTQAQICAILNGLTASATPAIPANTDLIGKNCTTFKLPGVNNGLTYNAVTGNIQLGGALVIPTTINTTDVNTLKVTCPAGTQNTEFGCTTVQINTFNPTFTQQNQLFADATHIQLMSQCGSGAGNRGKVYVDCGSSGNYALDTSLPAGANESHIRAELGYVVELEGNVELVTYPNTRNDFTTSTPSTFLYTDATGTVKTAPLNRIHTNRNVSVTAGAVFALTYNMDIIVHTGAATAWTLPPVVGSQVFHIANSGTGAITLSSGYRNLAGNFVTTIAAGTNVILAHDGATGYYQIG